VRAACIDDFALKKRQRYGTVMVDLETRKIVDMIETREMEDVARWLAGFPNLRTVSRDGSQAYATAIAKAHPNAIQISDRFHMLKNLTDKATLALQKVFQGRIAIPITDETQRRQAIMMAGTLRQRVLLVKELRKIGHSQEAIVQITGASIKTVRKYIAMTESEIPEGKMTVRGREHEEAVKKLLDRADRVRALHDAGLSLVEISQKTGFTKNAVRNYLSEGFNPVNGGYGKQQEGKLEPFREDVLRWKAEGLTYREIHARIREKGYTGTQDAIRGFISKERRIRQDLQGQNGGEPMEFIDKKWFIRLLYQPVDKVKGISEAQLAAILEAYPLAERILHMVNLFKDILKAKNAKLLPLWFDAVVALGVEELNIFVNGLQQDLVAVINAFTSSYSNGLAEGTVNKIKVVKRIMYGRCHFDLLKNKCLLLNEI
jgi:transposase